MRHQTIALFLIGLAMASCSADPKSAVGASLSGGVRFQHRVHERNGKTMLIVTPVRGRGARTYAEAFANQTCDGSRWLRASHFEVDDAAGRHRPMPLPP